MVNTVDDLVAEALFVSDLQPSQDLSSAAVHQAVTRTILRYGSDGCAELVAVEFGDHPDTAVPRMGWAHRMRRTVYPALASLPDAQPA